MSARGRLMTGLSSALIGAALGALIGELAATLFWPLMHPALALVVMQAGHGALIAAVATAVARRAKGPAEAGLIALPALLLCVLLTVVASLLAWGAR